MRSCYVSVKILSGRRKSLSLMTAVRNHITYSNLNQQQIDSRHNCTVNLTENRSLLLPALAVVWKLKKSFTLALVISLLKLNGTQRVQKR